MTMSNKESNALTEQNNAITPKNNALAVQGSVGFTVLAGTDFASMVSAELEGLDISFERVKIPSGGATSFELPTDGEDTEPAKEFSAVILHHHPLNAFYSTKYTGGSNPPDCGSFDGKSGEGNPGGVCADCPYNRFGTGENGSKACKNKRRVYILREGEVFPLLLTLPTGSLKAFTKYLKTQLSKGRTSGEIVTRFALKKVSNTGGIAYSQATFAIDRVLTPEEYAAIKPIAEQVKAYAGRVAFDDYNVAADDENPFIGSGVEETAETDGTYDTEPLGGNG